MEGDAGPGRRSRAGRPGAEVAAAAAEPENEGRDTDGGETESPAAERGSSRLGRGWVIAICAVLVSVAGVTATAGYLALRAHRETEAIAAGNAAAISAAKECIAATQAPDIDALAAAQEKIVDCATGNFGAQAALYSGQLTMAYQAADVHVHLSEMRPAVERNHDDGSVELLVALRVKVDNIEAQDQEYGYRLRVTMAPEGDQYKVASLDQVAG